jgi:uncharacterized protein (TIGR02246 family)
MTTLNEHADALDEAVIRVLYHRLLDCWNAQDAEGFASLFAEDGHTIGFDGSPTNGRSTIARHLAEIFAHHKTARYVGIIREVRRLTDEVELLQAVAGMVPPGASEIQPEVNAVQSLVAVRHDGEWRLTLFQNTPAAFHGRPELVQALTEELQNEFVRQLTPETEDE